MKENLVILLGPTAIGKTDLSLSLAKKLKGEIISCDSMQIYKYMDIGSAKVSKDEQLQVTHHMVDIVYPEEEFTVADFKEQAKSIIRDLNAKGKLPIVTGGTGLYINSLVYELNFTRAEADYGLRKELEDLAADKGVGEVHKILESIDPPSAKKLHPNDLKRVIRAIEIYRQSGVTMSEYNKNFRTEVEDYNLSMIGLTMDRQKLYQRINKRVDKMMDDGLIEEVQFLLSKGYTKDLVSMQGIGYKELIDHLEGNMSLEETIDLIKKKSRNYAKRQLTWFRRDPRIKWFNKDAYDNEEDILNDIIDEIRAKLD